MNIEPKFALLDGDQKIRLTHTTELRGAEWLDHGLSIDVSDSVNICSFMFNSDAEAVAVLERMLEAAKKHLDDNQ